MNRIMTYFAQRSDDVRARWGRSRKKGTDELNVDGKRRTHECGRARDKRDGVGHWRLCSKRSRRRRTGIVDRTAMVTLQRTGTDWSHREEDQFQ